MSKQIVFYGNIQNQKRYQLPWTPAEIDTEGWWDAADSDTIAQADTAGYVSQWDDKSGNGRHFKQAAGASQPQYVAGDAMLGGMPSIYNGGNQQWLQTDQTFAVQRVYFVTYYRDGVTDLTWQNHNALFGAPDGSVRLTGRVGETRVWDGSRSANNFDFTGAVQYRNGTSAWYEQNGLPMPANMFRITSVASLNKQWRILRTNQSWTPWDGGLGEFIFTDASEDSDTQLKIEGYLAWKWGLESLLPAAHPYKDYPPKY